MRRSTSVRTPARVAAFLALAVFFPAVLAVRLRADDKPSKLAHDLVGAWVVVGTPGKVEAPKPGATVKFIAGGHWAITEADPKTHVVVYHHGGTYTLDGDTYVETVEYANESTGSMINEKFRFKIKLEGETLTQTGLGNPYTEVLKRLK